jgi:hypothetical protein
MTVLAQLGLFIVGRFFRVTVETLDLPTVASPPQSDTDNLIGVAPPSTPPFGGAAAAAAAAAADDHSGDYYTFPIPDTSVAGGSNGPPVGSYTAGGSSGSGGGGLSAAAVGGGGGGDGPSANTFGGYPSMAYGGHVPDIELTRTGAETLSSFWTPPSPHANLEPPSSAACGPDDGGTPVPSLTAALTWVRLPTRRLYPRKRTTSLPTFCRSACRSSHQRYHPAASATTVLVAMLRQRAGVSSTSTEAQAQTATKSAARPTTISRSGTIGRRGATGGEVRCVSRYMARDILLYDASATHLQTIASKGSVLKKESATR